MSEKILIEGKFKERKAFFVLSIIYGVFAFLFILIAISSLYQFLIFTVVFGMLSLIFGVIHKTTSNKQIYELIITESKVTGKFGKKHRVDLPISKISAISVSYLNTVSIQTSSGVIELPGLINQMEVFECLSKLIEKNQKTNLQDPQKATAPTVDTPEQIYKYKELLDNGIITQDEFDAKKKQLLDL